MTARKVRTDALRNWEAVLAAAAGLFADSETPGGVSMDDIAAAAGVGKSTLFRRFGDRAGLIRAVFDARTEPLRQAVDTGPPPLGPDTPPRERVAAILDAIVQTKLENRHLSLALEEAGGSGSPYQATHYAWVHGVLRDTLTRLPGSADPDWTAHALLAATRADLVEHLLGRERVPAERIRANLAAFTARLLPPA